MWISTEKYDKLWERAYKLQNEKDTLIRILSGVVLFYGGKVIIPMPSYDSRALNWSTNEDGTVKITSKFHPLKDGKFDMEDE